jgi:hypothetical protein
VRGLIVVRNTLYYKSLEASFKKSYAFQKATIEYKKGYHVVALINNLATVEVLSDEQVEALSTKNVIDLRSDNKKLVLMFHPSIAHALQDSMTLVLAYSEMYPEREMVFFTYPPGLGDERSTMFGSDLLKTCVRIMESRGVTVTLVKPGLSALINNFDILSTYNGSVTKSINLFDAVERGISAVVPGDPKASAKLYLSRKKAKVRDFLFDDDDINEITRDNRVYNEAAVEQVFEEMGFEIVYAEEYESFTEQIKKMRTAKVVAGVTGAGLANFMLTSAETKNRLMVELTSPVVLPEVREDDLRIADVSFHPHYWELTSTSRNAHYVAIPILANMDGEAIAESIRDSPMFEFLKNY